MQEPQHVFLVGAKSLGAYGGYETFVNKLTEYHALHPALRYHVACKANGDGFMDETQLAGVTDCVVKHGRVTAFTFHNARCFKIPIPEKLGHAQAIYYDVMALRECCRIIREEKIPHPIVYIMACRIGPFLPYFRRELHRLGGRVYLNPDGHEWQRSKWSAPIRRYWKLSEQMMVKWSDLVVCDSIHIERYIHETYDRRGIGGADPKTTFVAYGAETRRSALADDDAGLLDWYAQHDLKPLDYYLIVGRFVPENNFETILREFMRSGSRRTLAIITNENPRFLAELEEKLHFHRDPRIRFVGTVYNQELLMKLRENAYGYFHGHEVGGTNPSLLEALASTELNLLLDVSFNREVAASAASYWSKDEGSLAALIDRAEALSPADRAAMGRKARQRIQEAYSWDFIAGRYEEVFIGGEW